MKTRLESGGTDPRGFAVAEPVSGVAKPLRSVSPLSRRVFSAQKNGARQKLKVCPEPSGNKLSESNPERQRKMSKFSMFLRMMKLSFNWRQ